MQLGQEGRQGSSLAGLAHGSQGWSGVQNRQWTSGRVPAHESGPPSFPTASTGSCPVRHTASLKPNLGPAPA